MWKQIEPEDQVQLIRSSCLELLCLRAVLTRYNQQLNCLQLHSGDHICKNSTDANAVGQNGQNGLSGLFEQLLEFAVQFQKLQLDSTEKALFAALLVLTCANSGLQIVFNFWLTFRFD